MLLSPGASSQCQQGNRSERIFSTGGEDGGFAGGGAARNLPQFIEKIQVNSRLVEECG
jgi:hypothetical protein